MSHSQTPAARLPAVNTVVPSSLVKSSPDGFGLPWKAALRTKVTLLVVTVESPHTDQKPMPSLSPSKLANMSMMTKSSAVPRTSANPALPSGM